MNSKLTYTDFFKIYFPDAYVCAMGESGVIKGMKIEERNIDQEILNFKKMNDAGCGIFFTPNAIKDALQKHALSNLAYINSWYIDLDIGATKVVNTSELTRLREEEKASMRGAIFASPLTPSITIENRNGFHLYWLALSASEANFKKVEMGIVDYFKNYGADLSTIKPVQLLRVPGFINAKHGESFRVTIDYTLSSFSKDSSFKGYREEEILQAYPYQEEEKPRVYIPPKLKSIVAASGQDIFDYVHSLPIQEVLARLSGTGVVNGERFELKPVSGGRKLNIFVDGKSTHNFIDLSSNHIYGAKETHGNGPTITQWLKYYGRGMSELAQIYKELFTS